MRAKPVIVVMGVAGTGKSTLSMLLARKFGFEFLDGDDFHLPLNLQKLRDGIPLTDEDRGPWLEAIVDRLSRGPTSTIVLSCSALKRKYRDKLRQTGRPTIFAHLTAPEPVLHFMSPSLLPSQLNDLQPLGMDEDFIELDATCPAEELVAAVAAKLQKGKDKS